MNFPLNWKFCEINFGKSRISKYAMLYGIIPLFEIGSKILKFSHRGYEFKDHNLVEALISMVFEASNRMRFLRHPN